MTKELLLPEEVRKLLPPLQDEAEDEDPMIWAKFFYPDFSWTWYAMEFDGKDLFFGLVHGFEKELGYFTLSELMKNRGKLGLEIERDFYFTPCRLSTLY